MIVASIPKVKGKNLLHVPIRYTSEEELNRLMLGRVNDALDLLNYIERKINNREQLENHLVEAMICSSMAYDTKNF